MAWVPSVGRIFLYLTFAIAPLLLLVFRPWRMGGGFWANLGRMVRDYWPQGALFGVLYTMKNYVDTLNDPVRGVFGDFTWVIHQLEGDLMLWIQQAFQHPWLTGVLNVNYLFGYILLTYFSFILTAYADDRPLANRMVLSVLIIYLLAIPFYVFFNVRVTGDYIPGMDSLLYHSSAEFLAFFAAVDPLDNAWPSLHIAIPWGIFVLLWWRMRRAGDTLATFPYRGYLYLVGAEILVFAFSILYLGVHWILDIPGGLLIGYLGAVVVDELEPGVHRMLARVRRRVNGAFARAAGWLRGG
jgi:membrane-associated phospholipid phosphatase